MPFLIVASWKYFIYDHTPLTPTPGIYQPETFKRETKYGLTVLTTTDQGLLTYLGNVMSQMSSWLTGGDVQRLVVVVTGIDSGETLERWQFNVLVDDGDVEVSMMTGNDENVSQNVVKHNLSGGGTKEKRGSSKTIKEVNDEIQAIIRQITASVSGRQGGGTTHLCINSCLIESNLVVPSALYIQVTFLPLLREPCSFDLLIYTNKTAAVPKKWNDSDPRYIMNSQEVKLRSFTTSVS
jgi:mitotic spindle assembly checkpoint protein MAD2